jgi:hypothetical protein
MVWRAWRRFDAKTLHDTAMTSTDRTSARTARAAPPADDAIVRKLRTAIKRRLRDEEPVSRLWPRFDCAVFQ